MKYVQLPYVHDCVPQGSILSPLLYALYIDGLYEELRSDGVGVRIFGNLVPLLFFADDIVLLSASPQQMLAMLDIVSAYARKWRFEVNHSKCGLLVYGAAPVKQLAELYSWKLCGRLVPIVQAYKYLGLEFPCRKSGKWNIFLERTLAKTTKSLNYMLWQSSGGRAYQGEALAS